MHRKLRIAAALSAFALGLTLAGAGRQLPYALPSVVLVGLVLSALWRRVRLPALDGHRLKVASLTLALWTPLVFFFLSLIASQTGGSCVVFYDDYIPAAAAEEFPPSVSVEPPAFEWGGAEVCRPDAVAPVAADAKIIWGGVIDRKARSKPQPAVASDERAPGMSWTVVAVAVVVDGTGRVVVARPLSGTSPLRRAAARAACEARFYPTNVNGIPPLVSGILTYDFGR